MHNYTYDLQIDGPLVKRTKTHSKLLWTQSEIWTSSSYQKNKINKCQISSDTWPLCNKRSKSTLPYGHGQTCFPFCCPAQINAKKTVAFFYSTKTMHFVELNIGVFMLNMNKNRIFSNLYFLCRLHRILIHSMCSICCFLFKLNNTIAVIFMNITFGKHV